MYYDYSKKSQKPGGLMKKLFVIITLLFVSFAFLSADVYIKQETNAAGQINIQETWLGKGRMASTSTSGKFIMDMAKKKVFMLNPKAKTYVETDLPLDMSKIMPEQMAAMMQGMMSGVEVSLNPNGQTKKIGNWNAKGYDFNIKMMGMDMKMTMWASNEVPFDWKEYLGIYSEMYKVTMMNVGTKFVNEFKKLEGYPLGTEMNMMGMNITTTTVEISEKKPGPDVYNVPPDYTKKDKLTMEDMRNRN